MSGPVAKEADINRAKEAHADLKGALGEACEETINVALKRAQIVRVLRRSN